VASPASRFLTPVFGGLPEMRPLSNRTALPSVSQRRDWAQRQRSSGTIRKCSAFTWTHSAVARRVILSWPQSSRLRLWFQTTTPRYSSRPSTERTVEGDHFPRGGGPSFRDPYQGEGARSAFSVVATAFNPRPPANSSKSRRTAAASVGSTSCTTWERSGFPAGSVPTYTWRLRYPKVRPTKDVEWDELRGLVLRLDERILGDIGNPMGSPDLHFWEALTDRNSGWVIPKP